MRDIYLIFKNKVACVMLMMNFIYFRSYLCLNEYNMVFFILKKIYIYKSLSNAINI